MLYYKALNINIYTYANIIFINKTDSIHAKYILKKNTKFTYVNIIFINKTDSIHAKYILKKNTNFSLYIFMFQ